MPRASGPAADKPLLQPERLFAGLAGARGIVAAVSGGPDSTALMCLLAAWSERPPTLVATVDHGLRVEAAAEARVVRDNAARLGLPCRILRAPPRPASGNLQDWARRARYRLLADLARETGSDVIVTAHHQDDQAETFLLRLARGSGVYGLGAMAEEGAADGVRLQRPLLHVSRQDLAAVAAASGLALVEDPSNADERYDRVRMRNLMPALQEHGLDAPGLSATAARLRRAATALDHYARATLAKDFQADWLGGVSGPASVISGLPEEVGLRSLALICRAAGGADYTPSLDRLERLLGALADGADGGSSFRRTLHGVSVELREGHLSFRREWGRRGLPLLPARAGGTACWDGRYRLTVPTASDATHIGALGHSTRRLRLPGAPASVARTLPGLYRGPHLVALPPGVETRDAGPRLDTVAAECLVGSRLGLAPVHLVSSP